MHCTSHNIYKVFVLILLMFGDNLVFATLRVPLPNALEELQANDSPGRTGQFRIANKIKGHPGTQLEPACTYFFGTQRVWWLNQQLQVLTGSWCVKSSPREIRAGCMIGGGALMCSTLFSSVAIPASVLESARHAGCVLCVGAWASGYFLNPVTASENATILELADQVLKMALKLDIDILEALLKDLASHYEIDSDALGGTMDIGLEAEGERKSYYYCIMHTIVRQVLHSRRTGNPSILRRSEFLSIFRMVNTSLPGWSDNFRRALAARLGRTSNQHAHLVSAQPVQTTPL